MTPNLNVLILAGGCGTRLHGVWEGPKCLAPIFTVKRALLFWLLREVVAPLNPSQVVLSLGSQAEQVMGCVPFCTPALPYRYSVDELPMGTTRAVTDAARRFVFGPGPTLILNGDTLPGYDMKAFVGALPLRTGPHVSMAWQQRLSSHDVIDEASTADYAGAALVTREVMDMFREGHFLFDSRPDVEQILSVAAQRVHVPKFLDIGTPERLAMAQSITEEEWRAHAW